MTDPVDLLTQMGEVLPEAFWATDLLTNQVIYVSPGFEQIWGIPVQALYEDPLAWLSLLHKEDRDRIAADIEERGGPHEHDTEYRVVRPDGTERWVHSRGFAVHDESGTATRLIGLSLDITTQKATEEALRKALEAQQAAGAKLEELSTLKDEVLRRVSHEIRTPLTSILGFSQLLDQGGVPPERAGDAIRAIAQNAEKLHDLVSDILDIDRLSRGIVTPIRRETDIHALLVASIDGMELFRRRPVQIDIDHIACRVDGSHVTQMLENLLDNAIRHTPDGTPITLAAKASGADLVLRVEDAGPGVAPEVRTRMFDPFSSHTPGLDYSPGLGIGLGLVKRLVELNGGTIEVRNRPGGGTIFTIVLPDTVLSPDTLATNVANSVSRSVILVIDDEEQIRNIAIRLLGTLGRPCLGVADGHQGILLARTLQPRLVILDINMPGFSGTDVLIRLRADARTSSVPVMMLTGESLPVVKAQHLLLGADDYMVKPFEGRELVERVDGLLSRLEARGRPA